MALRFRAADWLPLCGLVAFSLPYHLVLFAGCPYFGELVLNNGSYETRTVKPLDGNV